MSQASSIRQREIQSQYQQPQVEASQAQEAQASAQVSAEAQQAGATDRQAATELLQGGRGRTIPGTKVTEKDNGKTITIKGGENLIVSLPSNPSTGYSWHVASVSRSLSQPTVNDFIGGRPGAIGSGGTQQLIWKTSERFSVGNDQTLELIYARAWDKDNPAKTFKLTVNITGEASPNAGPGAGGGIGGGMGFVAPTASQIRNFVRGRVQSALEDGTAKKLRRAPAGLKNASHYSITRQGRESKVDAYVIGNELYMKTQSMYPRKNPQWFHVGPMPMW